MKINENRPFSFCSLPGLRCWKMWIVIAYKNPPQFFNLTILIKFFMYSQDCKLKMNDSIYVTENILEQREREKAF